MARNEKQLSYEEKYKARMETYKEIYKERTEFASKFKLKPEKTKGYYTIGDPAAIEEPTDSSGSNPAATVPGNGNIEKAWNFLAQKGLTAAAVAGVMGNLKQESGIEPKKLQYGGGPGRGICQWETNGRTKRWDALVKWAKSEGRDEWAIETQLEWMWKELSSADINRRMTNQGVAGFAGFQKLTDYRKAVEVFEKAFERASKPNFPNRYEFAQEFLNKYAKGNGSTAATTVGTSPTTPTSDATQTTTPGARSMSLKFQVSRDIRAKETEEDTSLPIEDDSDTEPTIVYTTSGSIKKGRFSAPNVSRVGYVRQRLLGALDTQWKGWAPMDSTFIHLAGPQENLYAPEAQSAFLLLKKELGWDKIKVIHGFQLNREANIYSAHNVGIAMDISVENIYEALYVADTAWYCGFRAIAIGGDELDTSHSGFVHIDCGPQGYWPLNHHDVYKGPGTFVIKR